MESVNAMDAHQLGELARFLDDHPAFSPTFSSDDAILCGFRVGDCFVTLDEMGHLFEGPEESHQALPIGVYTEWPGGI